MNATTDNRPEQNVFADMIQESVFTLMFDLIADESSLLGGLDQWSQRRVLADMMAKTNLVLEAGDPAEHCYQNLISEIDREAEMGVLLANKVVGQDALERVCDQPGVSGELCHQMERIAPVKFPDEYEDSNGDLELVWKLVQTRYDRARLDAEVSEHIMEFIVDRAEGARTMTDALRSMFYSFHEDSIRRQLGMSSLLDERRTQELKIVVSALVASAGSYEEHIDAIRRRQHDVSQIPQC